MSTSLKPKLVGLLATIALCAPVTGAQAARYETLRPAHLTATSPSSRHSSTHRVHHRSTVFQSDTKDWT